MKTKIRFASLFATAAIIVAACSSGGGATTAPGSGAPESTAPQSTAPEPTEAAFPTGDFALTMWTKEGEADGGYQFIKKLTDAYTAMHPNVTFEVVNKDVEALREDFQTASLAGDAPEVLMTVADHVGVFTSADLILPLDDMIDRAAYVPAAADIVTAGDKLWGAPFSFGNQLMLFWDKEKLGAEPPADSAAWIAAAKEQTSGDNYGIVFNQTESFWLVPFLGGFGGSVFAEDGVTPTLNTDAMKSALKFMYDLKYTDKVMPAEADYNVADGMFKEGKAASIINGDWVIGTYGDTLGDKLGVAPLPKLVGGDFPKPYIAGTFFMTSKAVGEDADLKTVVSDFMKFATNTENQVDMVDTLRRLPGDAAAIEDAIVTDDPLLAGAAEAAQLGVPQPTNVEMRCVFDSMTAAVRDLYTGNSDIDGIVSTMQSSAETCIAQL